jgi:hypothetical protein
MKMSKVAASFLLTLCVATAGYSAPPEPTPIPTPSGLSVDTSGPCGSANLSWDAVPEAIGYEVVYFRSGNPTVLRTEDSSIRVMGLRQGAYFFRVRALAPKEEENSGLSVSVAFSIGECASQGCDGPVQVMASVDRDVIWPPNRRMIPLNFDVNILMPAGCTATSARLVKTDEYGDNQVIPLNPAAGRTAVTGYANAWRESHDLDGRSTSWEVQVDGPFGRATSSPIVTRVPHSQR